MKSDSSKLVATGLRAGEQYVNKSVSFARPVGFIIYERNGMSGHIMVSGNCTS
jgi:hypothetical protein